MQVTILEKLDDEVSRVEFTDENGDKWRGYIYKQERLHCSNCDMLTKDIVKEDDKTIYYHCSNCDMADEEYK